MKRQNDPAAHLYPSAVRLVVQVKYPPFGLLKVKVMWIVRANNHLCGAEHLGLLDSLQFVSSSCRLEEEEYHRFL